MKAENRHGKRYRTNLNVRYGLNMLNNSGVVNDISNSGIFILTSKPYPKGSVMKAQILIPGKGHINLEGSVRWSIKKSVEVKFLIKGNGMGIKINRFHAGQVQYKKFWQKICHKKSISAFRQTF